MACLHCSARQFVLFLHCRTIGLARSPSSPTVLALALLRSEKSREEMLIFSIILRHLIGELRQGWPGVFVLRGWEGDGR